MNSKKGVSSVIATVLIILITVAAVSVVWALVIPMVRDNAERATLCSSLSQTFEIDKEFTQLSGDSLTLSVTNKGGDVDAVEKLVVSCLGSGKSNSTDIKKINIPKVGETESITLKGCADTSIARVFPVVKIGGKETGCDQFIEVNL